MSVDFDAATHTYTDANGIIIPSVTQVLGILTDMGKIPTDVLENARDRGKIVHALTEYSDTGRLTTSMVDDADDAGYLPYLAAWSRFKSENIVTFTDYEERFYSPSYGYAGTIDRVGTLDGQDTIFEIKTGDFYPTYALQTAAYQVLWEENTAMKIDRRVSVLLNPNGRYTLKEYDPNPMADFAVFYACLTILKWRSVTAPALRR